MKKWNDQLDLLIKSKTPLILIRSKEEERVEVSITKETFCLLIAFHKLGLQSKQDDFADIIDFTVDGLVNHAIENLHKVPLGKVY